MNTSADDQREQDLRDLMDDAVADVDPTDRLGEIRRRTAGRRRRSVLAVGGSIVAVAACVTAIAVVATQGSDRADPPPATTGPQGATAEVFYVTDSARDGAKLISEPHPVAADTEAALLTAVQEEPEDPDYRTLWTEGLSLAADQPATGVAIDVDEALSAAPDDVDPATSRLALQQLAFTLLPADDPQAVLTFDTDTVLGVDVSDGVARGDEKELRAIVDIDQPAQGAEVSGSFVANGRGYVFEATVIWRIEDATGAVVQESFTNTADSSTPSDWQTGPIDVSDLPAGDYTFVATWDDVTGGEGGPAFEDTRSITVAAQASGSASAASSAADLPGSRLQDAYVTRADDDSLQVDTWWQVTQGNAQGTGQGDILSSDDGFASRDVTAWTQAAAEKAFPPPTSDAPDSPAEFEELLASPGDSALPGSQVLLGSKPGPARLEFAAVAVTDDSGASWEVAQVPAIQGQTPSASAAVLLPDGRVLMLLNDWSGDRPGRPAAINHGLWISAEGDRSSYLPYRPAFSPGLEQAESGDAGIDTLRADDTGVVWVTSGDRLFVSTDGAVTFTEVAAR